MNVKAAVLSADGAYRYELTRRLNDRIRYDDPPLLGWIMLNPSTADADVDDPTIRRCMGFAQTLGYGGIVVRNLYALRSTDPRELREHPDPVGPDNDAYLYRTMQEPLTVCAWGTLGGQRGRRVHARLLDSGAELACLGRTLHGHPKHPLYLRSDTPLEVFR